MQNKNFYWMMAAGALVAAGTGWAQGSFTPLGFKDAGPSAMSADGTILVGSYGSFGPAWRWTAQTGVVNIGSVSSSIDISRDGTTIVGEANDSAGVSHAAIWQNGTNWRTLPDPPNVRVQDNGATSGWGVSADGSVIVGLAWVNPKGAQGFRYDAASGKSVLLGSLLGESSRASVVSGDGHVIAGWDEVKGDGPWYGVIWWDGLQRLMNPFAAIGQVEGINDSGSVMVGRGHPTAWTHAYRFTSWDGQVEDLGVLSLRDLSGNPVYRDYSMGQAVSDDSTVVVGYAGYQPPTDAFIWTPETKMVKLSTYLTSKGITGHETWNLLNACCVSPDGKIIAGTGINNKEQRVEGFIIRLP